MSSNLDVGFTHHLIPNKVNLNKPKIELMYAGYHTKVLMGLV
jgi:hypothetical protein